VNILSWWTGGHQLNTRSDTQEPRTSRVLKALLHSTGLNLSPSIGVLSLLLYVLTVNCCGSYKCPSPPACSYTRSFGACYRCSFSYHHPRMHFSVRHHHIPTAKNSRNWMSTQFYPVQLTSKSRNPPISPLSFISEDGFQME